MGGKDKGPSKKTEQKQKAKIVEDKTFGLKNKNKSAKVQQYVKQVTHQVMNKDQKGGMEKQVQEEYKKKAEKKKELEQKALLASLFGGIQAIQQPKLAEGEDPKSVLCSYFKAGVCEKGKKCKFSHDLALDGKSAKINVYADPRDKGGNRDPDRSDIICTHFLDAVEKNVYGWLWECPNGGNECKFTHALPQGYVLERDKKEAERIAKEMEDDEEELTVEEKIEEERAKLQSVNLTPVTLESFLAWKQRKAEEKKRELEEKIKEEAKKAGGGKNVMSGRALFSYNPNLFQDDDNAVEEEFYEEDREGEEGKEEEEKEGEEGQEAEDKEVETIKKQNGQPPPNVDKDLFVQEQQADEEEPDFD